MARLVLSMLVVFVVTACQSAPIANEASGSAPDAPASAEASEPVEESTAPTPSPTREPTPSPTPSAEADVVITREVAIAWGDGDPFVNYQVIAEITNDGDGWAQIDAFNSDYQVLDADGGPVTTGSFLYHAPEYIGPGEVGYLVEAYGVADGVTADQFASAEVSGRYDEATGRDTTFEFSDLQARAPSFPEFEGFTVTGFVTADAEVESAAITVICVDADGAPLGATSTNLVQNLSAGERKVFETVSSMPVGLSADSCAELRPFGDDAGF